MPEDARVTGNFTTRDRVSELRSAAPACIPGAYGDPTVTWADITPGVRVRRFAQVADMGLAQTVVWGSDYPHYDCTYPESLAELEATFDHLDRQDLFEAVTYTNARRFMGLA